MSTNIPKHNHKAWIIQGFIHSDFSSENEYVFVHPLVSSDVRTISDKRSERYQKVQADSTIKIPRWIVEELGFDAGTEIWIDVLDEDLKQFVIGKRNQQGAERGRAMDKLEEIMAGRIELRNKRALRD